MARWRTWRAVISLCIALGWWGMWFPELALWTESVVVEETEKNMPEQETARRIYQGLMKADREQIQVKSRLLQMIQGYLFGEDKE